MRTITCRLAVLSGLLLVLATAGCGAGGGGVVSSAVTATFPPIGALDGFVDDAGGVYPASFWGVAAGDSSSNAVAQGFLTFDISGLPAGAEVVSATLEVRQYSVMGSPYAALGSIYVDHVEIGGTLDATDWGVAALDGNFAVLSSSGAAGTYTVDVTDQVAADGHAGRTRTSFRLGFTALTDNDSASDFASFNDTEDAEGSGIPPSLTVRYRP